jgi:hypothetical protein
MSSRQTRGSKTDIARTHYRNAGRQDFRTSNGDINNSSGEYGENAILLLRHPAAHSAHFFASRLARACQH